MSARPVLVTRPESPGRDLTQALVARGLPALWLPAFDLKPATHPTKVAYTLARLARYDLAVFVSPTAVQAVSAQLTHWPAGTAIGAVGRATARAAQTAWDLSATRVIAPAAEEAGSEALLAALDVAAFVPRSVLILRAATGRDWLAQRLRERSVTVDALVVYDRVAHELTATERQQLASLSGPVDSLFTSSEALPTVQALLTAPLWTMLQTGRALASHPRIAQRLRQAGFVDVALCALDIDAIVAALRL